MDDLPKFQEEDKSPFDKPIESDTKQVDSFFKSSFDKGMCSRLMVDLMTLTHTLLVMNLMGKSNSMKDERKKISQQKEEEESIRQQDMNQRKNLPTLLEMYKESESFAKKINIYELPESPDVTIEPPVEGSRDKNLMKEYCEQIYDRARGLPIDKAFSHQNVS